MTKPSKPVPVARLRVHEKHGIRRFLYPLSVRVPVAPAQTACLRVADEAGTLIPSEASVRRGQARIDFAVSLAPHERRAFSVIETDAAVVIPDPMQKEQRNGSLILRQERFASTFTGSNGLCSVIYDGVEHLAGPLAITQGGAALPVAAWEYGPLVDGLSFTTLARGEAFKTRYDLTACKSWIKVTHTVADAPADAEIAFTLPLTIPGETPTCDFGVGNGAYAKIGGEAVAWTVDFAREPYACWEIAHLGDAEPRIDYEGQAQGRRAFASQAWFHWTLRSRALAVAVTHIPKDCAQLRAHLGRDGVMRVSFRLGRRARRARFGVCYHFLNDIAAIAAATNPASILLPPEVSVKRPG